MVATSADVKALLADYGPAVAGLSDAVIDIDIGIVSALVETSINQKLESTEVVTAYLDGGNLDTITLDVAKCQSVSSVRVSGSEAEFIADTNSGMVTLQGGVFPSGSKNVAVTMTKGFDTTPDMLKNSVIHYVAGQALRRIAGVEGNLTSLSVVAYSEGLGEGGRYGTAISQYVAMAASLLNPYLPT